MRVCLIIVVVCTVSYGDPAVFRHDDTVTCGYIGVIKEQPMYYEHRCVFEGWGEYSNLVLTCRDTVLTGELDVSVYSENGLWYIDDVFVSGELSPEESSAADEICIVYCGFGEPQLQSMTLTGDTLKMDISYTPRGSSAETIHGVWLWNSGEFSLLGASESGDF